LRKATSTLPLPQGGIKIVDLDQLQSVDISINNKSTKETIRVADAVSNILRGAYHAGPIRLALVVLQSGSSNKFKPSPLYLVTSSEKHMFLAIYSG